MYQEAASLFVWFDEIQDRLLGRPLKTTFDFNLHCDIRGVEVINLFLNADTNVSKSFAVSPDGRPLDEILTR